MNDEDIVTRLHEEIDSLKVDVQVLRDAADEIERLRAAGDALAINYELMLEQDWSAFSVAFLHEWKDARRG